MAFYGLLDWSYEWKFLPTETEATYAGYIGKLEGAVNSGTPANVMYRVDDLLNNRISTIDTDVKELSRMASKARLERLRETAAGATTWRHYFCSATNEEVFLMTEAHWSTEFTVA